MSEYEQGKSFEVKKEILKDTPYLSLFIDGSPDRGDKLEKLQELEASYDTKLQQSVSPEWKLSLSSFLYCGLALGALTTKDDIETNEALVTSMFYIGYELGGEDRMELMWPELERKLTRMRFLPQGQADAPTADLVRYRKAFVWSIFLMAFEIKDRQNAAARFGASDEKTPAPVVHNSITSFINSLSSIDSLYNN